jgi:hypothetical protein
MRGIRAIFWFKRFVHIIHDQMHGSQHFRQYMIRLNLQMIRLQFNRHMSVAQMIRRANQIIGRAMRSAMRDAKHRLPSRHDAHQRAIFRYQHIPAAHHHAALQKHAKLLAGRVRAVKAAFLPHIPIELHGMGAFDQHRGQPRALGHEFGNLNHVLIRTKSSAAPWVSSRRVRR